MDGIGEARAIGRYKGAVQDGVAYHLTVSRRNYEQETPKERKKGNALHIANLIIDNIQK